MYERHGARVARGVTACLVALLCAMMMMVGCAQQPQTTEGAQEATQSQAEAVESDGTEEGTIQEEAEEESEALDNEEQKLATKLAQERLDEATAQEPEITADLQTAEDDQAQLVGLDHRFKSLESLTRKILLNAHTEEISLEEAASSINDVLRYTLTIETPVYTSKLTELMDGLEAKGYSVVKFKNYWGGDVYKGINSTLKAPDGMVFELQFHTPESFATKEAAHKYYEIARAEDATEEEIAESVRIRREESAKLEIPEGALELKWE